MEDIKKLWQAWFKPKCNKTISHLTTEQTYGLIFPEKLFVKGRMEKTMSERMSELEKWLSFKQITEGSAFEQMEATLRFMSQRQLNNRFGQTLNRLKTEYSRRPQRDVSDYLETYFIELLDKEHQEHLNSKRGDVNLGATLMALDTHFVVSRLDLMLILVAQKRHIGINISQEVAIIADLDSIIGKKNLAHNLVIQSYRSAIQLLLEENNFEDYRAIL